MAPLTVLPANPLTSPGRPIQFVEVADRSGGDAAVPATTSEAAIGTSAVPGADEPPALHPGPLLPAEEPRWSLWGDPDR